MNEPSIQFRPPHKGAAGFGFGDGERVPIAEPDIFFDDPPAAADTKASRFDLEQTLDMLLTGAQNPEEIGQRAEILAFLLPCVPSRAKSLRELGLRLGCSHVTAAARLTRLRQCLSRDFSDLLTKRRIGE